MSRGIRAGRIERHLARQVMENNLQGLRAGGVQPDERAVRLAYGLTVLLRGWA